MELNETSAAFILNADMTMELALPKQTNPDDDMPDNAFIIAGIGLLMSNDNYRDRLFALINERMNES